MMIQTTISHLNPPHECRSGGAEFSTALQLAQLFMSMGCKVQWLGISSTLLPFPTNTPKNCSIRERYRPWE